jgi:hypothetical protein
MLRCEAALCLEKKKVSRTQTLDEKRNGDANERKLLLPLFF